MNSTKICSRCLVEKPSSEFQTEPKNKDGLWGSCRACKNKQLGDWLLVKRYGITSEDRKRMLEEQQGTCAICSTEIFEPKAVKSETNANVDHCHDTGKVRGLLCGSCNRGLGIFKDNPNHLLAAAKYLFKFQEQHESESNSNKPLQEGQKHLSA